MSGVLRGFSSAEYDLYASTKTLVRPCSSEKLLIYELETYPAPPTPVTLFMDGNQLVSNNKTQKTPNLHICIGVAIRHKDGWKVMSGAILRNEELTGRG